MHLDHKHDTIDIKKGILDTNDKLAEEHHNLFHAHNLYVPNIMSAPGAGKTTLLEKTVDHFKDNYKIGVIEGDVETSADCDRLNKYGISTYQINTGWCLPFRCIYDNKRQFHILIWMNLMY